MRVGRSPEKKIAQETERVSALYENSTAMSWDRVSEIGQELMDAESDTDVAELGRELTSIAQANSTMLYRMGFGRMELTSRISPAGMAVPADQESSGNSPYMAEQGYDSSVLAEEAEHPDVLISHNDAVIDFKEDEKEVGPRWGFGRKAEKSFDGLESLRQGIASYDSVGEDAESSSEGSEQTAESVDYETAHLPVGEASSPMEEHVVAPIVKKIDEALDAREQTEEKTVAPDERSYYDHLGIPSDGENMVVIGSGMALSENKLASERNVEATVSSPDVTAPLKPIDVEEKISPDAIAPMESPASEVGASPDVTAPLTPVAVSESAETESQTPEDRQNQETVDKPSAEGQSVEAADEKPVSSEETVPAEQPETTAEPASAKQLEAIAEPTPVEEQETTEEPASAKESEATAEREVAETPAAPEEVADKSAEVAASVEVEEPTAAEPAASAQSASAEPATSEPVSGASIDAIPTKTESTEQSASVESASSESDAANEIADAASSATEPAEPAVPVELASDEPTTSESTAAESAEPAVVASATVGSQSEDSAASEQQEAVKEPAIEAEASSEEPAEKAASAEAPAAEATKPAADDNSEETQASSVDEQPAVNEEPVASDKPADQKISAAKPVIPGNFKHLYTSRDGKICLFEDAEGHLVSVRASRLA